MKSFKTFISDMNNDGNTPSNLNESSLSRLWKKYQDSDSGTITAFRGEYSKKENLARNAELKAALLGAGYSVTSVDGVYIENYGSANEKPVKEKSFIVFDHKKTGKLKADLKRLGLRYDQDSITFNSVSDGNYYLIGTSKRDDSYPGFGKEIKLGKPMFGKSGEFHSSVKGRPFVFEETLAEDYNPHAYNDVLTNYSTWHIKVLTNKAKELLADD